MRKCIAARAWWRPLGLEGRWGKWLGWKPIMAWAKVVWQEKMIV